MIIKKIILFKYKRFALNNITEIEYYPKDTMQVILGRNMSGKSSLLKQLNPLPINNKDFGEDGYKYIEIEHNNNLYKLKSGKHHSFICNDKELNDGLTKKVYLLLVKEHFNLTQEVIDIMLNNIKFTTMSSADRKRILTQISTTDYTYSLGVFNTLKSKYRDRIGAIKILKDNIINYKKSILDENKLNELIDTKVKLEDLHTDILKMHNNHIPTLYNISSNDIKVISNKLKSLISEYKEDNNLENNILNIKNQLSQLNNNITLMREQVNLINSIPNIKDIATLQNKVLKLSEEVNNLKKFKSTSLFKDLSISKIKDYLYIDYLYLNSLINEIIETKYTSEFKLDTLVTEKTYYESLLQKTNTNLIYTQEKLNNLLKFKDDKYLIECNKCNNKLYYSYSKEQEDELTNLVKQYSSEVKDLEKLVNEKNKLYNDFISYTTNYNKFKDIIFIQPITSELDKFKIEINILKDLEDKEIELNKTLETIKSYNDIIEVNKNLNRDKLEYYQKNIEESTLLRNKLIEDLERKEYNLRVFNNIKNTQNTLSKSIKLYYKDKKTNILINDNKLIEDIIIRIKSEIVRISNNINSNNTTKELLKESNKNLDVLETEEKVYKILVKELSPTEGLIALSINSFLNTFIKELNSVINKIWTFPLEILNIDINEELDLDYKFKIKIDNNEIIDDISMLSSSSKEIVDLAFRIVYSKYLKISNYPLYLDEFGATFDKEHRIKAYDIINKVLINNYNQIFMILHYSDIYSSFTNSEFIVLDVNNIDLPNNYNNNILIK